MTISNRRFNFCLFLSIGLFLTPAIFGAARRNNRNEYGHAGALGSHIIYVSPVPGSRYLTPASNIIIRSDEDFNPGTVNKSIFSVVGGVSGEHAGKVILVSDQRTVLFQPQTPFTLGETVSVSMPHPLLSVGGDTVQVAPFSFTISRVDLNADKQLVEEIQQRKDAEVSISAAQDQVPSGQVGSIAKELEPKEQLNSLPVDFPPLTVTKSDSPSSGYIFLSTMNTPTDSSYGHFLIIADNQGDPVFYKQFGNEGNDQALDFTLQPAGVLSYGYPFTDPTWYVMNTSFQVIDSVHAGNGYADDQHDMKMLPDGDIILLADDYEQIDMSKIVPGGNPNATVIDCVIQELDQNKNVIFQWRAIDHFDITDGIEINLTGSTVDPFHCNAIEMDADGAVLLSTRYLSEITKIDLQTSNIIWRLGGKNNQFTFVNDPIGFSYQHDIRILPNGDITLMDNGNLHTPPFSRAVEYKLDEVNKIATLVWQFKHNPSVFNPFMGSVQRLPDGNTLIGWGGAPTPTLTEVTPEGNTALEMTLPSSDAVSYRVYRFPFLFITSPTAVDTARAGGPLTLRWESSGVGSVDIDYSTDGGSSWSNAAVNYPAHNDSLNVSVSADSGSVLQFRIVQAGSVNVGVSYLSDTVPIADLTTGVQPKSNPYSFALWNNYPNPFNPSTTITYELAKMGHVSLRVYDILGRVVETLVNGVQGPGRYSVKFDGSRFASGIFFVRLMTSAGFVKVNKMVLEK